MKPIRFEKESFVRLADAARIGMDVTLNITPKKQVKLIEFETLLYEKSHMTVEFDTFNNTSKYYPRALSYTNVGHYVQITTDSPEFNVRYIEKHLSEDEFTDTYQDLFQRENKYISVDLRNDIEIGSVFFTPGTNLSFMVDIPKLDELMRLDQEMLIKPHPLSNNEDIDFLSKRYGYDRLIEKEINAESIIRACTKVYYCDNSEIGLRALFNFKPIEHVNDLTNNHVGTYFPLYYTLRQYKEDKQAAVLYHVMTDPKFGYFDMDNSIEELSEQLDDYLHKVEELREYLKPRIPVYAKEKSNKD